MTLSIYVYKDVNSVMRKKSFPYPKPDEGLFSLFEFDDGTSNSEDTYTDLRIDIDKQNSLSRANTFFKKYSDIGLLKQWMVETFFPAIVANDDLVIYVKHRERILERLLEMIKPYGEDGEPKPELESEVQELLFKRGNLLDNSKGINHLHNLWILDDKFTTFSSTLKGKSTKPGEEKSDIYIWSDDPKSVKQVLILELKSTTHAHNAGNSL